MIEADYSSFQLKSSVAGIHAFGHSAGRLLYFRHLRRTKMLKTSKDFGANTHLRFIAELCEQGLTAQQAFDRLETLVINQVPPMIFKRNPDRSLGETERVAYPLATQVVKLRHAIGRVYGMLGRDSEGMGSSSTRNTRTRIDSSDFTIQEIDEIDSAEEVEIEDSDDSAEEVETEEPKRPEAAGKNRRMTEVEKYDAALCRIREILSVRQMSDPDTPVVANRPFEAGGNLIPRGFTCDSLLSTLALGWSEDLKHECGIPRTFDHVALSAKLAEEFDVKSEWKRNGDGAPIHPMLGTVRALADARQPIYLYGEHGTGKSYLAKQLATLMGLDYSETPMSLGASRGDLLGRFTASAERAFIAAKFPERFSTGGVFNFEEFDASDPRMIIVLNNALSSKQFYNSMNGDDLWKHDCFIPLATANTLAMGATSRFNREKLDAATMDRWNMGRTHVDFDLTIARYLLHNPTRPYSG
jgi:hypothetical protein